MSLFCPSINKETLLTIESYKTKPYELDIPLEVFQNNLL